MKVNVWAECSKLIYRRDAQAGLLVFALLPALLIVSLRYSETVTFAGEKTPISLTTAASATMLSTILAPMLVVIVTAGSLARERQSGEIQLVLLQPHRWAVVLAGKAVALALYIVLALSITLLTGLLAGAILFGTAGIDLAMPGRTPETMAGLLLTLGFAALGLMALAAITLLLACHFNFGATIMLAFTLLIVMGVLTQFVGVTPYLLTHAWNAVNHSLHSTSNSDLLTALWVLILYLLAGIGPALWLFERKDILS